MKFSDFISHYAFIAPLFTLVGIRLVIAYTSSRIARRACATLQLTSRRRAECLVSNLIATAASTPAEDCDTGIIKIYLNHNGLSLVTVTLHSLAENGWKVQDIFETYCMLWDSSDDANESLINVWNCLCAIIDTHLTFYLDNLAWEEEELVKTVAIARLLLSKYNINKKRPRRRRECISGSGNQYIATMDGLRLQLEERQNALKGSAFCSFILLLKSFQRVMSSTHLLILTGVALLSGDCIFRLLPTASELLCYSDLVNRQFITTRGTSFFSFAKEALMGSSGKLLAWAVLGNAVRDFARMGKIVLSSSVMHEYYYALLLDAIVSLSRLDYTPHRYWGLPAAVYDSLITLTSFNLDDIDIAVSRYLRFLDVFTICVLHPVECATLWISQQWVRYVQLTWSRMTYMRDFMKEFYDCTIACGKSSEELRAGSTPMDQRRRFFSTSHYGLTLLLSVSIEKESMQIIAFQTCLSSWPSACAKLSVEVCERMVQLWEHQSDHCQEGNYGAKESMVRYFLAKRDLLRSLESSNECEIPGPFICHQVLDKGFSGLRLGGWEDVVAHHVPPCNPSIPAYLFRWGWETVMASVFSLAQSVPLITTIGCSAVLNTGLLQCDPARAERLAVELDHLAGLWDPFQQDYVPRRSRAGRPTSHYLFDVYRQSSRYCGYASYPVSIGLLSKLARITPTIDARRHENCEPLPSGPWSIEFKKVWFRYPTKQQFVLKGVSFKIKAGEFCGVIGFSGAGKSTIALLISRIYAPHAGVILLNGISIDRYAVRDLRRNLANCWHGDQSMRFLDSLSIRDNLALGNLLDVDHNTITQALSLSKSTDFVESRGHGYLNTLDSRAFSGGEVECLAIARAMMKRSSSVGAYIFDESTSGLDFTTEKEILNTIRQYSTRGKKQPATIIMITHRLAYIQQADNIIVINQGEVVEHGSWKELVHDPGNVYFHRLVSSRTPFPPPSS
ncbi:unnamed protein product [Phytomonas sp. EM1]|nr:unnamed protein product [Phytomonas sp. EM1]|eukprot:CCW62010.1 unnamed protein product [Phytomonas sp. isolate EM1]